MKLGGLAGCSIEVATKQRQVNGRGASERGDRGVGGDEASTPQWRQLTNGHSVSRDDEGLAMIQLAHDLAAVVAKLSLGNFAGHWSLL
jgi:hypothetical protein